MKKIGEFAKENDVTIRALHHYEQLGLITPTYIDDFTGYRYYDEDKMEDIEFIVLLKSLGFSLSEIISIKKENMNVDSFTNKLERKKKQCTIDRNSADNRYRKISNLLNYIYQNKKIKLKEVLNMSDKHIEYFGGHELFLYESRRILDKIKKEGGSLCTLTVDIDRFKKVNDNYGHDVGDIVIERIKNTIINSLDNKHNSQLERNGGDEFRIIIQANLNNTITLAKDIIKRISEIDYGDIDDNLKTSVSVGIAELTDEINAPTQLFAYATTALYVAKATGVRGSYKIYK